MFGRPGFSEWIEGSAFVDRKGRPIVLYHGTDTGADFNIFARTEESSIGFHFGNAGAAHKRIENMTHPDERGSWGAVIPVVCNARNPLRLTDHLVWNIDDVVGELHDLGLVTDHQHDFILHSCSEYALFAAIELAGYDCIVYENDTEHADTPSDSFIIWRAEQVKGFYAGSFDRQCPGLVPGIAHDPEDLECWESIREELEDYKDELLALLPKRSPVPIPVF